MENLDDDRIIKKIDMVRRLRAGTAAKTIAKLYSTTSEYVLRQEKNFALGGVLGLLTEEDIAQYRSLYPQLVRICSFNLHGPHNNNNERYKKIARELSRYEPDLCAFQEVISGNGLEETSAQIARQLECITCYPYRTHYVDCHLFMDKYPEGVAIAARHPLKHCYQIDLTRKLEDELTPLLPRYAASSHLRIWDRALLFVCVHFDHAPHAKLHLAQAKKLLHLLDSYYDLENYHAIIIAGDFNEVETSPAIKFLRSQGYKDPYREIDTSHLCPINLKKRIDYILIKGPAKFHRVEFILDNAEFSDHIGMYLEMKF